MLRPTCGLLRDLTMRSYEPSQFSRHPLRLVAYHLAHRIAEKRGPGWSHGYADLWYTQANAVGLHLFFYLDKEGRLRSGQ